MLVETRQSENALVVTVTERRIDAAVAMQFKSALQEVVGDLEGPVVLDLSRVDFLDSSGLGAVVGSMKFLGRERRLLLAGLTQTVEKVFRITRMDNVFEIYPSVDEALQC